MLRRAADDSGQAEIGDLHPASSADQDILRLDVAMHDPFVVGELQRLADLRDNRHRFLGLQFAGLHQLSQVGSLDILHDEIVQAVDLSEVVNRDDVLVPQFRQRRASRVKRSANAGSAPTSGGRILTATSRSSEGCRARYTAPMPPIPSKPRISNCGNRTAKSSVLGGVKAEADAVAGNGSASGDPAKPSCSRHLGRFPQVRRAGVPNRIWGSGWFLSSSDLSASGGGQSRGFRPQNLSENPISWRRLPACAEVFG